MNLHLSALRRRSAPGRTVGLLLILLVVCAAALPAASSPTPTRGGTLVVGVTGKMSSLDPVKGNAFLWEGNVVLAIYDRLLRIDKDGNFVPELATSWKFSDDKLKLTFKLRRGVVFHDGTPFDAEAARFNLARLMDKKDATQVYTWFTDMTSVDVMDKQTVQITLSKPNAEILTLLTSKAGFIVSPTALKKYGDEFTRHPTGTGPFKFVEEVPGDHVTLARNENYWQKGADRKSLPYLDGLTVRIITDDSVRLVQLQTGTIQLMQAVPAESMDAVRKDTRFRLGPTPQANVYRMYINFGRGVFKNLAVRQAINYAFDRKQMADVLVPGQGFTPPFYIPETDPYYSSYTPYSYDVAKAKALLAQAGYPNGLETTMIVISREPDLTIGPVVQSYLEAIGIKTKINVLERLVAVDKAVKLDYDLYLAMSGGLPPSLQIFFNNFWSTKGPTNREGYSNPAFDALYNRLTQAFEPQERKKLFADMQKLVLDDGETVLFGRAVYQAEVKGLTGYNYEAEGALRLTEAWLGK
jgi:peptide/nickel transport system substrate-binding protein